MNITELTQHLQQHNIRVESSNGKVCGLGFSAASTLASGEAWALVEENGLKNATPAQPAQEPQPEQKWEQFRIAMMNDAGYKDVVRQALLTNGGTLLITRTEAAVRKDIDLPVLKTLWQELLNAVLAKPNQQTVNQWNQYCTASNMPFRFGTNGSLTIT